LTTILNWFPTILGVKNPLQRVNGHAATTCTYAISAYHHWCWEFESRSGRGAQHYVIKFVSGLRQVSGCFYRDIPWFSTLSVCSQLLMTVSIYDVRYRYYFTFVWCRCCFLIQCTDLMNIVYTYKFYRRQIDYRTP
jgi:hypothetical protein